MKIEIEISDEKLREEVTAIIAKDLLSKYAVDGRIYRQTIAQCVREVIYKDKANIVDRIVAQASRECRSKAVKAMLERMDTND